MSKSDNENDLLREKKPVIPSRKDITKGRSGDALTERDYDKLTGHKYKADAASATFKKRRAERLAYTQDVIHWVGRSLIVLFGIISAIALVMVSIDYLSSVDVMDDNVRTSIVAALIGIVLSFAGQTLFRRLEDDE